MRGSHWRFGFLLIWGMFQSTEADKGECPRPHRIKFAETFAGQYVVGTIVVYACEAGYKRKSGASSRVKCQDRTGYAQWQTEPHMCIVDPSLPRPPSEQPATEKWEGISSLPQATTQPVMKDFCGIPRSPKHARVVKEKYYVGQKLTYMCLNGYQARGPISEVSTCKNLSGVIIWSSLTLSCTNDSSIAEEATIQLLTTVSFQTGEGQGLHLPADSVSATGWFHFPLVTVLSTIATVIIL